MRKMSKVISGFVVALLTLVMVSMGASVKAAEASEELGEKLLISARSATTPIGSPEDLLEIANNPYEAYHLVCDIDMSGIEWKPFAFHGLINGGGYSILNLTIAETGDAVRETYDGNMKVYDTKFAALFDELSGANINNLNLVNLRIDVETDEPCFIGSFAGYMENSTLDNCTVQGMLQLRAHDRMFGVGGLIGYGCGSVDNCHADVTLVCIDTDATTKDEQFMGGVCAAGYPDMHHNTIVIRGYDSDHGYVHDGGLVGMYMFYPKGTKYKGSITGNYVSGKITFYEDNKNRRAYCDGFIGEIMNWDFDNGSNIRKDFVRDEVFTYDIDLMPHDCANPVWKEEVIAPGCDFGYTKRICETCGYEETDHYTLKDHAYEWTVEREATETQRGSRRGVCKDCGAQKTESIPMLEPKETPAPETAETESSLEETGAQSQEPAESQQAEEYDWEGTQKFAIANNFWAMLLLALGLVGAAGVVVYVLWKKSR